jgi:hypothetical protein
MTPMGKISDTATAIARVEMAMMATRELIEHTKDAVADNKNNWSAYDDVIDLQAQLNKGYEDWLDVAIESLVETLRAYRFAASNMRTQLVYLKEDIDDN